MTEMYDNLIRAARAVLIKTPDGSYMVLDEHQAAEIVLSILTALRSPTEEMVEAGLRASWPGDDIVHADEHAGPEHQVSACFTAMITRAMGDAK